jgi:hypothetical protein
MRNGNSDPMCEKINWCSSKDSAVHKRQRSAVARREPINSATWDCDICSDGAHTSDGFKECLCFCGKGTSMSQAPTPFVKSQWIWPCTTPTPRYCAMTKSRTSVLHPLSRALPPIYPSVRLCVGLSPGVSPTLFISCLFSPVHTWSETYCIWDSG